MDEFADVRERMVADQLAPRGVADRRVLQAMRDVPRHLFVPPSSVGAAYDDRALPIGDRQTISQPYMVAVMTEALGLTDTARVLEIGTGSGYQAAILAKLARDVISIERRPELARGARERLAALGYLNVAVVAGDGSEGHPPMAPYNGIIVTAGAPAVPASLKAQLAEGGRLVIPVGPRFEQRVIVIERRGDTYVERSGDACVFVPLVGREGWPEVY